ncbi:MAG: TlyA family RNA methyltransferase, partial [Oscillospiraceae bacterium]
MKTRIDTYLLENFGFESREKAKAYIMSGMVYINGEKSIKSGDLVKSGDVVECKGKKNPYVSRGGLKLEKAIKEFEINLTDKICMDIGASTGGFTHCMLLNGSKKVYSIDVGYGQLAWSLRTDGRVINLERTNFRIIEENLIAEKIDFSSVDVSFISLRLILPNVHKFLKDNGTCVCLIKPQFEAGREKVGKKGVVKEIETHIEVCELIYDFCLEIGFKVTGFN